MDKVTWRNPETGKTLAVFVSGETTGRNGETYLRVSKVKNSPCTFLVRPSDVAGCA